PASHSSSTPTKNVETEMASHQTRRQTQPNPSQSKLVWIRRVSPLIVAPDSTTGSSCEMTSPVTVAPPRSVTLPLKTMTSPLTRPEMVTGASNAGSDPLTVASTVDDPWNTTRSPT